MPLGRLEVEDVADEQPHRVAPVDADHFLQVGSVHEGVEIHGGGLGDPVEDDILQMAVLAGVGVGIPFDYLGMLEVKSGRKLGFQGPVVQGGSAGSDDRHRRLDDDPEFLGPGQGLADLGPVVLFKPEIGGDLPLGVDLPCISRWRFQRGNWGLPGQKGVAI